MVSTEIIKNWGGQNGGGQKIILGGHLPPLAPPLVFSHQPSRSETERILLCPCLSSAWVFKKQLNALRVATTRWMNVTCPLQRTLRVATLKWKSFKNGGDRPDWEKLTLFSSNIVFVLLFVHTIYTGPFLWVQTVYVLYLQHVWPCCIRYTNAFESVNSKLDWNDNVAGIFEAKLIFNKPSCSVPFHCNCRPLYCNYPKFLCRKHILIKYVYEQA